MSRFSVVHTTHYKYTWPVLYSIQQVRLYPRKDAHQNVIAWKVDSSSKCVVSKDTYENTVHTVTLNTAHQSLSIVAKGIVEISPTPNGVLPRVSERVSPQTMAVPTLLTQSCEEIRALAANTLRKPGVFAGRLMLLANAVAQRVVYTSGATDVHSSAIEALREGRGVCQDHAHVMLACLRAEGIACRYVSGYYFAGWAAEFASHAWLDVWDKDNDCWISIDPTHGTFSNENHCRLAIGRDYETAAPVRGVRSGGGEESLHVEVQLKHEA